MWVPQRLQSMPAVPGGSAASIDVRQLGHSTRMNLAQTQGSGCSGCDRRDASDVTIASIQSSVTIHGRHADALFSHFAHSPDTGRNAANFSGGDVDMLRSAPHCMKRRCKGRAIGS
jgi:hypothetical protein